MENKFYKGENYWFFERYNYTGRILVGELVYVSSKNIAKLKVGEDNYWNLDANYLFASKENLMANKEKILTKGKENG